MRDKGSSISSARKLYTPLHWYEKTRDTSQSSRRSQTFDSLSPFMHTYKIDVPNLLCALVGNLNTFDHVKFQLSYVQEMNQIRCVLRSICLMFCFPLCNKDLNKHLTYHREILKVGQVSGQVMLTMGVLWVNFFPCS